MFFLLFKVKDPLNVLFIQIAKKLMKYGKMHRNFYIEAQNKYNQNSKSYGYV